MHQNRDEVIRGLASTGLVNRFPDAAPHEAIIEWLPRLDVDGLELGIGRVWDLARVEHDLSSAGLRFATAHSDKRIGTELLDDPQAALAQLGGNCRLAVALGLPGQPRSAGAALVDDALWERVVHVHVKDYAGILRDREGTRRYLIQARA